MPSRKKREPRMRLSTEAAYSLDNEGFERLSGEIEEWIELGGHVLPYSHPEWSRTHIATPRWGAQSLRVGQQACK